MAYFQDWWSYGENCIIKTFQGVLASDKKFNDICIYEQNMLNVFTDSIAKQITKKDSKTNSLVTSENTQDVFLNKKIQIDFQKNVLFVFSECTIKELVYSPMFECYLITYNDEPADAHTNYAILAHKIYPLNDDYYFANEFKKEPDINETDENKNQQKNEESDFNLISHNLNNIKNNTNKPFMPKFETMNDKPKAKAGQIVTGFNEDY